MSHTRLSGFNRSMAMCQPRGTLRHGPSFAAELNAMNIKRKTVPALSQSTIHFLLIIFCFSLSKTTITVPSDCRAVTLTKIRRKIAQLN